MNSNELKTNELKTNELKTCKLAYLLTYVMALSFAITFWVAYISKYLNHAPYTVIVRINEYGEAHMEMFLVTLTMFLGLYLGYKIMKMEA